MTIIRPGDLLKLAKTMRFECRDCGCVFDCDQSEYITRNGWRNDTIYEAGCPCCGIRVSKGGT